MNLQKLKAVLDTGEPFADDAAALVYMKANVTVQNDISYQDLVVWASEEGTARKVHKALADEAATPGTWIASVHNDLLVLDAMLKSGGNLALSRDDVRGIVNGLSGSGKPLSAPNKTALFAKSNADKPRFEAEGFPVIDDPSWLVHINDARAL